MTQGHAHYPPLRWWFVSYHCVRLVLTNMRYLLECALILDCLHLRLHFMILLLSIILVLCLTSSDLLHRMPQTNGRYLMMVPSGFWQPLLKDTRGWYGGTVPVPNIG